MTNFFSRFISVLLLLFSVLQPVQAQTTAPDTGIRIQVYGIHYGGNIVYNYKVINNGETPFNNFTIGSYFNSVEESEFPQLTRLPLGWQYGRKGITGPEIILAQGSTVQPPYWEPHVFTQEETANYYLKWRASRGPGDVSNAIGPGQILSGFSVTIPMEDNKLSLPAVKGRPVFTGPDEKYVKGGFKVGYSPAGKYQEVWGALEPVDTTPPGLTVSLSPNVLWPPNEKLVPITATIMVKDDYDPNPEIQLVSIIANEPLDKDDASGVKPGTDNRQFMLNAKRDGNNLTGRIYTVTYRAVDGSGNIATASATVTVPHDQGK